jgi:hypothetical protein
MKSDVPHDSISGLLFFNIFINDISVVIHSYSYLLFADDLKMYHRIMNVDGFKSEQDCSSLVLTQW